MIAIITCHRKKHLQSMPKKKRFFEYKRSMATFDGKSSRNQS